ncbi:MAG TPA: endonuclease/exonuclease/phosphatase family protein [Chitinispirillaceae bacterium]|nr:endonuclease/exonuclease/phosphatase family protein [Chitinispirillaceae bacterium]
MSFNIRYGTARDGKNSWKFRRPYLQAVLKDNAPDIIATQEALRFQLDEIAEDLNYYGEVGVGRENGKQSGEYAALLYNHSLFSVAESGTFWFSETPHEPGSCDWGNKSPRICTWAMFLEKKSSRGFYVFNVHLDHWSNKSREKSVKLLIEKIIDRKKTFPVIIAGDFNAGENNSIIRFLKGTDTLRFGKINCPLELIDTYRTVNPGKLAGTLNFFRGFQFGPKIDFIFADKNTEVISANIIRTNFKGRYPSDHFPITACLRFSSCT